MSGFRTGRAGGLFSNAMWASSVDINQLYESGRHADDANANNHSKRADWLTFALLMRPAGGEWRKQQSRADVTSPRRSGVE